MTARQCFCTSRVQAFCSSGVPRPSWARAAVEKASDVRARARRYLRILFLHSEADVPCPARALAGKVLRGVGRAANPRATHLKKAQAKVKCGQICGGRHTLHGLPEGPSLAQTSF